MYQYFSSKHDLYLAVLEKAGKNLQDTISTALNQSGSNRTIVRASVRAFFDFVDDDMQYYRLLFDSDMLDDIEAAEHVEQVMSTVVTYIAHHISHATTLDPARAQLLASSVVGASTSAAKTWVKTARHELDIDTAADLIAGALWSGLQAFPARHTPHR